MATSYKFPGVYPSIRDLSGIVSTNSTTACAYVGEAEYGPVFKPTLLSTLQDYTDRFGTLSSKYGYAGYSLAVAAESISEHQFVRVVPTGSATDSAEERVNNAKWGAVDILASTATIAQPVSTGYFYEEVTAAQTNREAGEDSGLFDSEDLDSAFMVVATDPNNRKFYISIEDTTINEYKATVPSAVTCTADDTSTTVSITMATSALEDMEVGSKVTVSKMSADALNGIFEVLTLTEDGTNSTLTYKVDSVVTETTFASARVGRYPDDDETTFSVTVSEKVGSVMQTLETFDYCTLYQAQDNYGVSTFVEDVINDSSDYIQVFVNKNQENDDPDAIVIPQMVTELPLAGNQSGSWSSITQKYTDLCAGWELFRDRTQVTVTLLMNSGYVLPENITYQSKMLEIAEARRDCFCLFDVPMTKTEYEDVIDWRHNIQGFTSYRGAVSSPWVKTYDSVQGRSNFVMCPSAYLAKIMGTTDPWLAPAGLNRGVISSSTVSPTGLTQLYNTDEGGVLYADNQINCIIKSPSAGYVNWGQRTCQVKPSALDRINVARTIIYIETILRDAARWHVFENNTAYERTQINLQFTNFLNTILAADGIQKFQVVCDSTNNTATVIANNQLVIDIYIWPTYTAEVIKLNTTIMGSDTTVSVTSV